MLLLRSACSVEDRRHQAGEACRAELLDVPGLLEKAADCLVDENGLKRSGVEEDECPGPVDGLGDARLANERLLAEFHDEVADLARELLSRGHGWTFPGSDHGHLSPAWVSKLVRQTLPEGTTMHQLRHRFATQAWSATHDLFAVQRLLGHASPTTTQRYVATAPDELRHVVNAVAGPRRWAG